MTNWSLITSRSASTSFAGKISSSTRRATALLSSVVMMVPPLGASGALSEYRGQRARAARWADPLCTAAGRTRRPSDRAHARASRGHHRDVRLLGDLQQSRGHLRMDRRSVRRLARRQPAACPSRLAFDLHSGAASAIMAPCRVFRSKTCPMRHMRCCADALPQPTSPFRSTCAAGLSTRPAGQRWTRYSTAPAGVPAGPYRSTPL